MESPETTTSPLSTSTTTPPSARCSRHPWRVSVRATEVTKRGRPPSIARPFRWPRSSGTSFEIHGGVQTGSKLWRSESFARQL